MRHANYFQNKTNKSVKYHTVICNSLAVSVVRKFIGVVLVLIIITYQTALSVSNKAHLSEPTICHCTHTHTQLDYANTSLQHKGDKIEMT